MEILNKNQDFSDLKIMVEPSILEDWLLKKSKEDSDDFFSNSACFLINTLCYSFHQDLVTMIAFLDLDSVYERLGENKLLAKKRILAEKTAFAVVMTARRYFKEYVFEFHKTQLDTYILSGSSPSIGDKFKELNKLYPLLITS